MRTAIYVRTSTVTDSQQHSIEEQIERLRTHLLSRGAQAAANFGQKRRLLELLIDRVMVTQEEVDVGYLIPTSASGEHARFCHLRTNYLSANAEQDDIQGVVTPFERRGVTLHE